MNPNHKAESAKNKAKERLPQPKYLDCEPIRGELPQVIYRDEEILVVDKPAGWLTHRDGEGTRPDLVSFFKENLGIHQRLDVETSGVVCLSRNPAGAKRLAEAFEQGRCEKTYMAVVEGHPSPKSGQIEGAVPRDPGKPALTMYKTVREGENWALLEVAPKTGRTHQIRAHLSKIGHPCRGDQRYGDPYRCLAPRTLLHCLRVKLPSGQCFEAALPPVFARYRGITPAQTRAGLSQDESTTCYRELNSKGDGCEGFEVDRYQDWLLIARQATDRPLSSLNLPDARGIYLLDGLKDRSHGLQEAIQHVSGEPAPLPLTVAEHGIAYAIELGPQLSTGLFLDQRPQRLFLREHSSGQRILNCFAHAGGFSVASALSGAETVSIDLSKQWLSFIPRSLALNGLDASHHDQIYGDVFDWMRRLAKRGEKFDSIILDPPSTSVGVKKKRWSAAKDYPELVSLALPLLSNGGHLWTLCNLSQLPLSQFASKIAASMPPETKLDRIFPPSIDFPADEPSRVKVLRWTLP